MGSVGGRLVGSCWSQAEAGARLAEGWNDQSTVSEDFLLDYLHTYIPLLNNENTMHCEQGSTDEMLPPESCRLFARARETCHRKGS